MFASAFDYNEYKLSYYQRHKGPPIIDKKSRILASTVQNQIEILQELLDSPKWYNITDSRGYNLLQIAILCENEKIFDYLLSILDLPVNHDNKETYSLTYKALRHSDNEHFVYELIKKGVSLDVFYTNGDVPLHYAISRSFKKTALLLIEKGVDLVHYGFDGYTPLKLALNERKCDEVVFALLANGATATVNEFEKSVLHYKSLSIQEALLLYIFDEYSNTEIDLHVIFHLADRKSPLFYELLKYPIKARVGDEFYRYFNSLCTMDIDYLKIFTEKFSKQIRQALEKYVKTGTAIEVRDSGIFFRNLNFLFEKSNLSSALISYITTFNSFRIHKHLILDKLPVLTEPAMREVYCFLLSYGLTIYEWDVHLVYNKFGSCELFKIFLHMDIEMRFEGIKDIMPTLIYDVTAELDRFLDHPWIYGNLKELCSYFLHPRLEEMCLEKYREDPDFPRVPLLTELCRNTFRQYFIELFEIRTSRKFYTLLNCLPISRGHKKIISYETKLY